MKKLLLVLSLLFSLIVQHTFAQYYNDNSNDQDQKAFYERKIVTYTKMKRAGWTLAAVGTAVTIAGFVILNSASDDPFAVYDDPALYIGAFGVSLGITAGVGGVVLGIIGANKQKEYMGKLERLDLGYRKYNDYNSLTLTYRF